MKKILLYFIALCNYSFAQTWSTVGSPNFANGDATDIFSAVAPNGDIYVIYRENSITSGRVKKFDGSNWVAVGPNFSSGDAGGFTMAFDKKSTPYIAYTDYGDSISAKGTVKKFDGSNWVSVGNPSFIATAASFTSIKIDSNGIPYIAFRDYLYNYRASVMKFDGSQWIYVGAPGFSAHGGAGDGAIHTSLAIDKNGTPYVAYTELSNNFKANVMKFDGNNWVYVGSPDFSAGQTNNTSLAIDSKGIPYVAYWDRANNGKATVMQFDGSSWIPVGNPGLTPDVAQFTSLAIDKNDILYLGFEDHAQNDRASVMTFNGNNWMYLGTPGFSDSVAWYTSIAIDNNKGVLYVAYEDVYNANTNTPTYNATVMKYTITTGIKTNKNNYSMNVYPNPVNNIVTLNIQSSESKREFTLLVISASGQSVYSEIIKDISGTITKQIDLSALPKGSYFVELQSTSTNTSRPITEIRKIILQ